MWKPNLKFSESAGLDGFLYDDFTATPANLPEIEKIFQA